MYSQVCAKRLSDHRESWTQHPNCHAKGGLKAIERETERSIALELNSDVRELGKATES